MKEKLMTVLLLVCSVFLGVSAPPLFTAGFVAGMVTAVIIGFYIINKAVMEEDGR